MNRLRVLYNAAPPQVRQAVNRNIRRYWKVYGIVPTAWVITRILNKYIPKNKIYSNSIQKMSWFRRYKLPPIPKRAWKKNSSLRKRVRKLERGITGKEVKQFQATALGQVVTTAEYSSCLNGMAQGVTSITREGLECMLLSIRMFGYLYGHTTPTLLLFEWALVIDRDNQGATPTWAEVFEADALMRLPKHEHLDRFRILAHNMIDMTRKTSDTNVMKKFSYYKKFPNAIKMDYLGTDAGAPNVGKNSVFFMCRSSEAANGPTCAINFRIRYTD